MVPGCGPVFLVGAARSGTSLLYKVMALHPDASWLPNWVQRFPHAPQLAALNRIARTFPETRSRVWFGRDGGNAYVYGRHRPLRDRLFPMPAEAETFYAACGISEEAPDPSMHDPVDTRRLRSGFATISRWDGRRPVVSKRIANNRRIPLLAQAFPQARFVEIVRDGRAVALSLSTVDWWESSEVWWYGGTPTDWRREGRDPWELCARNWVEEVRITRRNLEPLRTDRVLSLRYEDLVRDPVTVVERVMAFSALDPTRPQWRAALDRMRFPNQNEQWRTRLTEPARTVIEAVQGEELTRYGYT